MKIVFFDGYCSLCNAIVDWLMKVDKTGEIKFASLQGETAKKLLRPTSTDLDTVIYLRGDQKYERSTAILFILADTGGPYRFAKTFLVIPNSIRDFVYKIVSKNRYRILPKRETCRTPSEADKNRLLP